MTSTWITRLAAPKGELRVAVKDLIDVAGVPTTAANRLLAERDEPAARDAACVALVRAAGGVVVGKANLHELAFGGTGINPWFGTPVNPLDGRCVPGGSSSGSAVAVAIGEADVALGTDTAGSVRTPSACCGTVGLKTTFGRVSTEGVRPLAPSLDVVGPMARDVAGVISGMTLLEPGFAVTRGATLVGRIRVPGTAPIVDDAIDRVLAASEIEVIEMELPGLATAAIAGRIVLFAEAWRTNRTLYNADPTKVGADVASRLALAAEVGPDQELAARATALLWKAELSAALERVEALAWPTLPYLAPRLDASEPDTRTTNVPVSLAGSPSLALPVPTGGPLPASVQLVGRPHSEELLCATGLILELAATSVQ